MNHLWNLIKKELRELLTPATIIPIVLIVVILAAMGPLMSSSIDDATSPTRVGFVNEDVGVYSDIATDAMNSFYDDPEYIVTFDYPIYSDDKSVLNSNITKAMEDNDLKLLLLIAPGYSADIASGTAGKISVYWYQKDLGGIVDISEYVASSMVAYISQETSKALIGDAAPGADTDFMMNPVSYGSDDNWIILNTGVHQGVTPSQISSSLMMQNMFISIVMMMIIIMIGSILVSSMGSEKENKTLETLLTLPVSRTTVVGGKIIGSAIVGLIFGAVYLVGMYFMMDSAGSIGGVDLAELGLALSITDWVIVGVFLFMAIVCALGLCMILGAFAKNYKAAQTLIMPITVLAMVPMLVGIFGSFSTLPAVVQGVMFAIPFSHPMSIMENLMFDNTVLIVGGLAYLIVFALATLYATVRIYRSDILLTGFIKKSGSGSKFLKKPQK